MKVNREKIVEALEIASPALCTNPLVPAYQCFHIRGDHVVTLDGVMLINSLLETDIEINTSVPGASFLHLIKSLKEEFIELVVDKDNLCVKTDKIKGTFAQVDSGGCVEDVCVMGSRNKCLPSFLEGLSYCRHSVSSDATSVLGGVYVCGNTLYGTDRYRIMRYRFSEEGEETLIREDDIAFVLPVSFINTVLNVESRITDAGLFDGKFRAKLDNGSVISTTISTEDYPSLDKHFEIDMSEFQKIQFPKDIKEVIDRHIDFQKAVSGEKREVTITIDEDDCNILTIEEELGKLDESLSLPTKVSIPVVFVINPLFLQDILKVSEEFWCCPEKYLVLFLTKDLEAVVKTKKIRPRKETENKAD